MKSSNFKIGWKTILKLGFLAFLIAIPLYGLYFWYRLDEPMIIKSLPDPFILNNGTRVSTEAEWNLRRNEIKETLQNLEYGHLPGNPDRIEVTNLSSQDLGEGKILNTLKMTIIPNNSLPETNFNFTLWVALPNGTGPFPTIVKVSEEGTGSQEPARDQVLTRGYIYVCFNHIELDPDITGNDIIGPCQQAYPSYDWGSIGVWAWGAMRVADYLLNETWVNAPDGIPNVDPSKLIITGHSRRGKTALLAGAFDERFTMVVPNESGCAGAGSFLIQGYISETIADITSPSRFRYWFNENFTKFAGNEVNIPFDQHFLRSLVAPRLILSMEATEDFWSNPIGSQAIYEAANPVFKFLDKEENNAIHYRGGFHGFTSEDFDTLMNFADKMLLNKSVVGNFYMTPYNIEFPIYYSEPL
ncbi:MAG: hypothetical protein GF317_20435 [Candidatus Lokiarchaeota archaeon]|nr:hypothetical protein [Candidatus Lokiarchaeota archaeon]MBD3201854.1 hypothetical protein [Candidatus Lokiarchaeota archaeon]